jgi:hypothetical protein
MYARHEVLIEITEFTKLVGERIFLDMDNCWLAQYIMKQRSFVSKVLNMNYLKEGEPVEVLIDYYFFQN